MSATAAIDFGTNTFHIVVVKHLKNNALEEIARERIYVYLDRSKSENISNSAYQDAIQAASKIKSVLDESLCSSVKAVATEVFRKKSNGSALLDELSKNIGHKINLISGDEEARLTHIGVSQSYRSNYPYLIMDIGGGSTEFILSKAGEIIWKKSYELGLSVLVQQLNYVDFLNKEQAQGLNDIYQNDLVEIKKNIQSAPTNSLVLNGGAAELLPKAVKAEQLENRCYRIDLNSFKALEHELLYSTLSDRSKIDWLVPERTKLFPLFLKNVSVVLEALEINELIYSPAGLKEGLIFS